MQKWTSVFILLENDSLVKFYPFLAVVTELVLEGKNIQMIQVSYSSKSGSFDFGRTLQHFSTQSRGMNCNNQM